MPRYKTNRRPKRYDEAAMANQGTIGWIDLDSVAAIVKFLVHQSGKTQVQLARELGTTTTTMSAWYRGEDIPMSNRLLDLIDKCGFDLKLVPKKMEIALDDQDELIETVEIENGSD